MRARTALTLSFFSFVGAGSVTALGTYLVFNPRLRKQMMASDSPIEAMELLGSHVRKDAQETADQTMEAVRHSWLTKQLHHARRTLGRRFSRASHIAKRHAKVMKREAKAAKREIQQEAMAAAEDLRAMEAAETRM